MIANQNFIQNRLQNAQNGFEKHSSDLKHYLGFSGKPFRHATSIVKKTSSEVLVTGNGEFIRLLNTFTGSGEIVHPITGSVVGNFSSDGVVLFDDSVELFFDESIGFGIAFLDIAGNTVDIAGNTG
jgi:hypothetical protein